MGGSSEQENLQLLCGPCNRRKAAGLTIRNHHASAPIGTPVPAQPPGPPPANWYPDPQRSSSLRYWDGHAWTDHLHAQS